MIIPNPNNNRTPVPIKNKSICEARIPEKCAGTAPKVGVARGVKNGSATLQSTKADDYSLVSVLMTNEQAKLIENYGNYNTDGTILQVRGTFYLSCSEHQGLSDIHAKEVTVVKQGSPRKHPVNDAVLWTSCLAVGLGVLSLFTYSFLRERRK